MGGISASITRLAAGACALGALAGGLAVASQPEKPSHGLAPSSLTAMRKGSLCQADETAIFSCPLGPKLASICGTGRQAVYRYGTPSKVEMTARTLTLAKKGYAGGGETQIAVTNKDYAYILYDRTVRTGFGAGGRNDPDSASGLLVRHAGRTLSARRCDDDAPIPSRAAALIPAGGTVIAH